MYPWRWQEVTVTSQEHAPPQLWCHGACKVMDSVLIMLLIFIPVSHDDISVA